MYKTAKFDHSRSHRWKVRHQFADIDVFFNLSLSPPVLKLLYRMCLKFMKYIYLFNQIIFRIKYTTT
jgi:hypothetical protein